MIVHLFLAVRKANCLSYLNVYKKLMVVAVVASSGDSSYSSGISS